MRLKRAAKFRLAHWPIEGAWKQRGDTIWDAFCRVPGRIRDDSNGNEACDSYHRFPDDVALLREMNLTSYRFGISWARVQPSGRGDVQAAGLDYYRRLADDLLAAVPLLLTLILTLPFRVGLRPSPIILANSERFLA